MRFEPIPNYYPLYDGTTFTDMPTNYVYVWFRSDGNPFYVGVGRKNRYKSLLRRNPYTLNVVKTEGGIGAVRKVIFAVDSWESGCALEQLLIARFGRSNVGTGILTNMTDGGEGTINKVVTERTKRAVAEANRNRVWTNESKTKSSETSKGRQVTIETREKLRVLFKGKRRPSHVLEAMRLGAETAIAEGRHRWVNSDAHKRHFTSKVQPKAAEWHASEEGKEFHSKLSKESWRRRGASQVTCQFCGKLFETPFPTRAKFCHINCKQSALRLRRGEPVGTRPNRKVEVSPKQWKNESDSEND
jgi:hypothetical protein